MRFELRTAAAAILAVSLVATYGFAQSATPAAKKHVAAKKAKTPPPPTVEEQIEKLRSELEGQINGLKSNLAEKDVQLKQAQQSAADAQAVAAKAAQEAADAQQQAATQNAAAVKTLETTVNDLKGNQLSLATTVSDETAAIKKSIASPSVLHYKGISITPGGFLAAETVYRSKATGGDIPTAFSSIPYEGADAYKLSEFFGSGRQSRISMKAEGKTSWGTLTGYMEGDFLGTGITSNNNQSNSYVYRQRALYADATTNSGWTFAGGQMWSLAAEGKKGITSSTSDINTPLTIDPNYVPGFVWARQYGFRVVKNYKHSAFGVSVENPQLLYSAALAGDTPYAILGSAGANGGNYNAAVSGVAAKTYIQSYSNVKTTDAAGATVLTYLPVYNTIAVASNVANISFNYAPDIIAKAVFDPGWGHYEIFGIAGFAHELVLPGVTQNSVMFGNVVDIQGFNGAAAGTKIAASNATTAVNNSITLGGFGASLRVPVIKNKLSFGVKGLYGPGMGRYGDSTLSDVTDNGWGGLAPIHNLSGLFTVEATPTPRLTLWANYGGDYAARADYAYSAITLGSPTATFCATYSGTYTCLPAGSSSTSPTLASLMQTGTGGAWGSHFTQTATMTAVGYGSRYASVSASCSATASPSNYNTGSIGYLPAGSGCGNNTRNVQEVTGGYWYDLYKGDHGRLRQGIQYGYSVREGWSGSGSTGSLSSPLNGAKGIDNMVFTTFRYYLP
jgi:Skp family chaperone for outer membrane proteins